MLETVELEPPQVYCVARGHAVVAVCDSVLLKKLQGEMRRFLGHRPTVESITHVVDASPTISRVKYEFDSTPSEDHRLVDVLRHLCTLPGVRYVRLHSV